MKILILAAGYGTRLYPMVKNTPKPLLAISKKPIINHLLDNVETLEGLNEVIVVTNNKFYNNFLKWAEDNASYPVPIKVINDGTNSPDDRLGSVGDISYVIENYSFEDDLLVVGGDNLFDFSLQEFIDFSQERETHVSIGLYDIGGSKDAKEFGVVEIDKDGKIINFEEKPAVPRSSLIAMCFYYLPQVSQKLVSEYLKITQKSDKAGDYIHWLAQEKTVYGFKFQGTWYDIGSIQAYKEAEKSYSDKVKTK